MTAREWLAGLARRGIATRVVNGRIRHFPSSAYKQMTDDEVLFLRHSREAIKLELLDAAGPSVQASADPAGEALVPTTAPAPKPSRCPWCNRSPCIGEEHEYFRLLHPNAPPKPRWDLSAFQALAKDERATVRDPFTQGVTTDADDPDAVMMRQIGKPAPAWWQWWRG
jgi:hypothetical protein